MANALDRVKPAEAKYAAMAGTAEKLEATLKKLKGTAQTCQSRRTRRPTARLSGCLC